MIDLPWGPKIVHIHQYHEVETLLQPKTRKKIIYVLPVQQIVLLLLVCTKNNQTLQHFQKTQLLILQLKIAIILIVYWFEVTHLESCLVPSHPFLVTAQCPWCCGQWAWCTEKIGHQAPFSLKPTLCRWLTMVPGDKAIMIAKCRKV